MIKHDTLVRVLVIPYAKLGVVVEELILHVPVGEHDEIPIITLEEDFIFKGFGMKLVGDGVVHPLLELNMVVMSSFLAFFLFFFTFFLFTALKWMETDIVETSLLWEILVLLLDFENNVATQGILLRIHYVKAAVWRRVWDE